MKSVINVFYKNKLVGILAKNKFKYSFQYSEEWLNEGFSISPISLPLKNIVFTPNDNSFNGLFGVFSDSCPDSWGRLLIKRYLQKNNIIEFDELDILSLLANNSMGALTYKPTIKQNLFYDLDDFDTYQSYCNNIIDQKENVNIDLLYKFGGSSGGARPKALVKINNVDWIVKFQSKYDRNDSGKIEYDYYLACKNIGILMAESKLLKSNLCSGYFATKRFDRNENGEPIHMISVSGLLEVPFDEPALDYNDLFKLTKILTNNSKQDLLQLFLRMCFNVYAHNHDDHAKNFAFLYIENEKRYRLSPAYDMTYSSTSFNGHTTTINSKWQDITDEDLINVGLKGGISKKVALEKISIVKRIVETQLSQYLTK